AGSLLLSCMVGPDYSRPPAPMTPAFKETSPEAPAAADGWKLAQPADQSRRDKWWEIFGDPQLNALEEQVTVENQDLKTAEARFREARAMISCNRSFLFPTVSTAPSIASIRDSAHKPYVTSTSTTGDFILPFDLTYELDLWGRVRRTVNAARREAQATAADLE